MLSFELVTLDGVKFSQEIFEVILPTPDGYIAVFPDHMPLVSLVEPGVISIRRTPTHTDSQLELFAVNGGVVEINKKKIRILVDEADNSEELNEQEIADALKRAKQLASEAVDQVSLDKANQQIQVAQARIRVADIKRRSKRSR